MAEHRYVSCLVACVLLLALRINAEDASSELWQKFNEIRQQATTEQVAVQFLQRFKCFSACSQALNTDKCLPPDHYAIIQNLELENEESLKNLSSFLLDVVLQRGPQCEGSQSKCKQVEECALSYLAFTEQETLESMLLDLKLLYHPQVHQRCFESTDLHHDAHVDENGHDLTSNAKVFLVALFLRLYQGECVYSNNKIDFMSSIFVQYSENGTDSLSEEGLEKLMVDIGIVRHDEHDHDHDHDHDHSKTISVEKRSNLNLKASQRTKRSLKHDHEIVHNMPNSSEECWSARQLFEYFDDGSNYLDNAEFHHLCPALVQQRLRGSCAKVNQPNDRSTLEVYGYGTLAVFLISFCSVLGVVLMPIQNTSMYQYVMICFIALAFGTLTGDALLHLIPEAVGLHTHEGNGEHSHEDKGLPEFFWKFFVILSSVYGLFVFEGIADLAVHGVHSQENEKSGGHGHSHIPSIDLVQMTRKDIKTVSNETLDSTVSGPATMNGDVPSPEHRHSTVQGTNSTQMCCGMTTLALVIIIGDAIHNVADGLTIGAAFSSSNKGGLSSALAIFFHELPHEFGDFVILLAQGFSFKKALIWNFAASLTAFIGLYVGIGVGENEAARQWILTVAAGMFLYIAVGDMLPELKNQKGKNGLISFIVQNIGVLIGMTCMILMSVFEDKIKV